jgi:CheY-like chemotaxis protein
MPGIDGGELARRIVQTHPGMPVLLITGYAGPAEDMADLPRLAKPFGQAEIAAALQDLFADEKVIPFPGRRPS